MDTSGILNTRAIYKYGFTAVVFLLPWSIHWCAYAIIFTSIVGLLSSNLTFKKAGIKTHWSSLLFPIFYALYVIGIFYSSNWSEALVSIEQKIFLVALPVIAVTSIKLSKEEVNFVLRGFVLSTLTLSLFCISTNLYFSITDQPVVNPNFDLRTQLNLNEQGMNSIWSRLSYITLTHRIIDPTYFSFYLVFSTAILLFNHHPFSSKVRSIVAGWFFIVIILLASRIGILLLSILIFFVLLDRFSNKTKVIWTYSFAILLMVAVILVFPVTRYRLVDELLATPLKLPTDPTLWNSTNLRLLEWTSGLHGIYLAGPFGTGTGATWPALQQYAQNFDIGIFKTEFNAHNQYIETFLEIGVLGFLCLLGCYFSLFYYAIQWHDKILLQLAIIIFIASLTESILERANGLIFFTAFASLLTYAKSNGTEA